VVEEVGGHEGVQEAQGEERGGVQEEGRGLSARLGVEAIVRSKALATLRKLLG